MFGARGASPGAGQPRTWGSSSPQGMRGAPMASMAATTGSPAVFGQPAFRPGQAQPVPEPSMGTTYGQQPASRRPTPGWNPGGGFPNANPAYTAQGERAPLTEGQSQWRRDVESRLPDSVRRQQPAPVTAQYGSTPTPSNTAFANAWNISMGGDRNNVFTPARSFGGGGLGNLAYMPDNARPAPFSSYSIGPDGRQVTQQQALADRDSFIGSLLQDNAQQAGRSGVQMGPPSYHQAAVQDLFARNNIQAPPGFMDQLLGVLGQQAPPAPAPAPARAAPVRQPWRARR